MKSFPIIPIWLMAIICILVLGFIIYTMVKSKKIKSNIIDILIIILLFFINLRFMILNNDVIVTTNNLDVLFVIDNTISMNADDYAGNKTRFEGVKKDCQHIIEELAGSRFSVITFNNSAKRVLPFTKDINLTNETIEIISSVDEFYAKGSSLNTPIQVINDVYEESTKKEDRLNILFFISDGEITDDSKLKSYEKISSYIHNGAVLGYGSKNGGGMKLYDKYTQEWEDVMDRTEYPYKKAISKLDEDNLEKIASDMNIDYIHMNKQTNIDDKLDEIKKMTVSTSQKNDKRTYNDTYQYLLIPLFILLILKYCLIRGEWL